MSKATILAAAALLLAPVAVSAQTAPSGRCPQLPPGAGLVWESQAMGDSDFCRALRSDGSEAFGLYITPEPSFEPKRSMAEERGRIDGQEVRWYRAEIASAPGIEARETLLELNDGRYAHIWLQAGSEQDLATTYQTVGKLRFVQSRQVAGN